MEMKFRGANDIMESDDNEHDDQYDAEERKVQSDALMAFKYEIQQKWNKSNKEQRKKFQVQQERIKQRKKELEGQQNTKNKNQTDLAQ